MDIKHYIDKLDAISHLERHEQFPLLEQAKAEGLKRYRLISYPTITFCLPLLFILAVAAIYYAIAGFSSVLPIVAIIGGLLASRVVVMHLDDKLIQQGLESVLANQATSPKENE